MDQLEAMSVLIAVADAGSFSAASRKLGAPLPTISRKVAELEAHLKTRLLTRSTRKLSLTETGRSYLAASKRILELVNEADTAASGEYSKPRGELIVTAPTVFGRLHVLPIVDDFLNAYPEINVRMTLLDRAASLVDDHIDLAIRIGALPDSSMIATRVGVARRVVCGSPDYFAARGVPKTPKDLVDLTCVTFSDAASGTPWTFKKGDHLVQAPRPFCRLNINTAEAAIDAAIASIGVTHVLSYQVARAVEEGKLRIVLQEYEAEPSPINLLYLSQGFMPLKTKCFLEFAVPRLRASLGDQAKLGELPKDSSKPSSRRPASAKA